MKISEAIAKLEELKERHGDLEIGHYNQETNSYTKSYHILFRVTEQGKAWYDSDDKQLGEEFIGIS